MANTHSAVKSGLASPRVKPAGYKTGEATKTAISAAKKAGIKTPSMKKIAEVHKRFSKNKKYKIPK